MVYGVCEKCSHTQDLSREAGEKVREMWQWCFSCGCDRWFRVVRQIEQQDGSVIEVTA